MEFVSFLKRKFFNYLAYQSNKNRLISLIKKINILNRFFKKKELFFLFFFLFLTMFIKVVTALMTQLWRDEVYIFLTAKENSFLSLLLQRHWDTAHPPLYFIFLKLWGNYFYSPFLLRVPSLIVSFLILYCIPILVKKIDRENFYLPFVSLFFISFSHFHNSLTIVVRPYPFEIFFVLVSLIIFIDILNNNFQISWKKSLFWGLTAGIAFLFDYSAIWFVAGQFIFLGIHMFLNFFKKKKKTFQFFFVGINVFLFFFILIFPLILSNIKQSFRLERYLALNFFKNPLVHIKDNLLQLFGVTYEDILFKLGLTNDFIIVFYIILNLLGFLFLFFRKKLLALFILIEELTVIVLPLVFSFFIYPIFLARHLNVFNLFFIIFISYFFSFLFEKKRKLIIFFFPFFVLIIINFFIAFPKIHYVDPPYDFLTLHKKIYSYPEKEKKVIFTHAPLHMFVHLRYYNLFYPIKNLQIFDLSQLKKGRESLLLKEIEKAKIFYVDFLFEKSTGNQYMPENFSLIYDLNCPINKRYFIDYIYLIECL